MVEVFIFVSYCLGTAFGLYWGVARGQKQGIVDTVDKLVDEGYLKYKGLKSNPQIMKYDEEY